MMFILNFDYVLEEDSSESLERLNLTPPPKSVYSKSTFLHNFTTLIKLNFPLLFFRLPIHLWVYLKFLFIQYLQRVCRIFVELSL